MPGRDSTSGAGAGGRRVLASSSGGRRTEQIGSNRTVLVSSRGTVAPGFGAPPVDEPPLPRPSRRHQHPRRRRSGGERALRWAVGTLAVIVVLAAVGYGYIRYRIDQIKTESCSTCTAAASGQPFNVLLVGSDTRAGNTGTAVQQFGSASQVAGQRSDTIKILHVDPATGKAALLSIPRDTYVDLSDISANSGLSGGQKINSAFNNGPESLIATLQNTLGISISHFVIVDFQGLTDAVNTVGGIYLDFPYPVRDNDSGNNNSGLQIPHAGCQLVSGAQALALARSRYFQYLANGYWHYDPTSDLGRIERQNIIISAVISKVRGSYNPFTLNAFLGNIVHDITVDQQLSFGEMVSLATSYHAFSPSSLQTYTLPTTSASTAAGSALIVEQPQTEELLTQFLGAPPSTPVTPPLLADGTPMSVPSAPPSTPTTAPPASSGSGAGGAATTSTTTTLPGSTTPTSFDPTVCKG